MADTISTRTVWSDYRRLAILVNISSAGDGAATATIVDVSAFDCTSVDILKITYNCAGMGVTLKEDAGTDVTIMALNAAAYSCDGIFDFTPYGGLHNSKATDWNGDILATTVGGSAGDSITLFIEMIKNH